MHFQPLKFITIGLFALFSLAQGFAYAESIENVRLNPETNKNVDRSATKTIYTEKHLVIHVDINKTIIASDQAGNKTVDNVINHLLAERYSGFWNDDQVAPMTYRDYIHDVVLPGKSSDQELKGLRKAYLDNFVNHLQESNHSLKNGVNKVYLELLHSLSSARTDIFPSFIYLIKALDAQNIDYSIVLRSFGNDLEDVVALVNDEVPSFYFDKRASFQNGKLQTEQLLITQPAEIYSYISTHGHMVIQDDWSWWNKHHEHKDYGKPFFINTEDNNTLSIFFDDNIEINSPELNILAPYDVRLESALDIDPLIKEKKLVKVDTIEAILDNSYFINKIADALDLDRASAE